MTVRALHADGSSELAYSPGQSVVIIPRGEYVQIQECWRYKTHEMQRSIHIPAGAIDDVIAMLEHAKGNDNANDTRD